MPHNADWSQDELLAALELYCRTPFGRQHAGNPDVIGLARLIGRTPGAVAYKLNNFVRNDPEEAARGIRGASHGSVADGRLFARFLADPDAVTLEMSDALHRIGGQSEPADAGPDAHCDAPTERDATVPTRLMQGYFRRRVMAAYSWQCAMCDVDVPCLLNAAHIMPWARAESRRTDPRNGLALCVLHDRAFDRGLVTVTADYTIHTVSARLGSTRSRAVREMIGGLDGCRIHVPRVFAPDREALTAHQAWAETGVGDARV
jgi:hypothetical protein